MGARGILGRAHSLPPRRPAVPTHTQPPRLAAPHLNCAYSTAPVDGSTATRPTSTACAAAPLPAGSSTQATK